MTAFGLECKAVSFAERYKNTDFYRAILPSEVITLSFSYSTWPKLMPIINLKVMIDNISVPHLSGFGSDLIGVGL